jgi:hypothetical protein
MNISERKSTGEAYEWLNESPPAIKELSDMEFPDCGSGRYAIEMLKRACRLLATDCSYADSVKFLNEIGYYNKEAVP